MDEKELRAILKDAVTKYCEYNNGIRVQYMRVEWTAELPRDNSTVVNLEIETHG